MRNQTVSDGPFLNIWTETSLNQFYPKPDRCWNLARRSFSDSPLNILPSGCTSALVNVGLKPLFMDCSEVSSAYPTVWKEKGVENDLYGEGRPGSC